MANKETLRKKKYEAKSSKSKGQNLSKEEKLKIIDTIQDTYIRTGSLNKSQLARDLQVSRKTMISLINDMNIEMESIEVTKIEIKLIFERIKARLLQLWDKLIEESESSEKINIRNELAIIKEMKDTLQNFYSMLQEFGEAPKQAQNVNVQASIVHADLSYLQEIKNLR